MNYLIKSIWEFSTFVAEFLKPLKKRDYTPILYLKRCISFRSVHQYKVLFTVLGFALMLTSCVNSQESPTMERVKNAILHGGLFVSFILAAIIIASAFAGYLYIRKHHNKNDLLNHRGIIEMIPSLISTLGVLGTFLGITMGLYFFNEKDLTTSIPLLLGGLKTAFLTSLAGMTGSLLLSGYVNRLFDEKTGGISDTAEAAGMVVQAVQALQSVSDQQAKTQNLFYNTIQQFVQQISTNIEALSATAGTINIATNSLGIEVKNTTQLLKNIEKTETDISAICTSVEAKTESILLSVGNIEETGKESLAKTTEQASNIAELLDNADALVSGQGEINDHVSKFGERLHGEIVEIEEKMGETNKLLIKKFDEFSELLRKSNTEALVNVMKKVTEEFQTQMNTLINKLIQENFEQLNKSVEQLNVWQQENKAMIQSLTSQYKQMSENFEGTSTSLAKVKEDTRLLVGEGGKLRQIVDALNKVIVEDEKFIKISSDLQNTANLTKSNYEQFDAATKSLNDWVRKQRNFVDGVTLLIHKLDELNKLRDYGEQFWQETRQQMNKGIGIIQGGTDTLNQQVAGLNNQFYARLSTTLAQLDNCIQALIDR